MNVKRYYAKTAREALRALKAELGADAIVLSNRAVDGGIEILALPAEAIGAIHNSAPAVPESVAPRERPGVAAYRASQFEADDDYQISLSERTISETAPLHRDRSQTPAAVAPRREPRSFNPPRVDTAERTNDKPPRRLSPFSIAEVPETPVERKSPSLRKEPEIRIEPHPQEMDRIAGEPDALRRAADEERIRSLEETNSRLMSELSGIRGMIERQLASFAWSDARRNAPARAEIVGELLEAGFSAEMARELARAADDDATPDEAKTAVRNALAKDLRAMSSDADLIDRGGVYALVGATGVGKTTTTAKIAARCVVRHGAERLALITTDGYRIGAHEQLRIYGRILGVPVFQVRDASDLRRTLAELRDKHMVLIDTVGMSQRDRMVAEQIAMLSGAGHVRRLLLLNATCRGDTLDDVVRAYGGEDLAGCILTKVDEAVSLAPALGAAIAHKLEVFYVANGQRVPEDLHLPNRAYLLHRALRSGAEDSAWKLKGDEASLMMAAAAVGC